MLAECAVYLALGLLAKLVPSAAPVQGFYGWFALFMPIPMLLFFFQVGGFKKNFRSTAFSTCILVALVPVFVQLKQVLEASL
ncbi:MAG: hypothetical protein WAW36_00795 [Methylovulum miyakonense]|uniref:hypothetical protein n=1 Tax=Methylovulum miyakonense TaxID=645578 RepID=UPI003BB4C274